MKSNFFFKTVYGLFLSNSTRTVMNLNVSGRVTVTLNKYRHSDENVGLYQLTVTVTRGCSSRASV